MSRVRININTVFFGYSKVCDKRLWATKLKPKAPNQISQEFSNDSIKTTQRPQRTIFSSARAWSVNIIVCNQKVHGHAEMPQT